MSREREGKPKNSKTPPLKTAKEKKLAKALKKRNKNNRSEE